MESLPEPSSVVDLTRDEDGLVVPSQNNEVPTKCSICLDNLNNECHSDSCLHTFCFECLKRWSDVQPSCPLCRSTFKNIHHSFTSHGLHETYNVGDHDTMNFRMNMFMDDLASSFGQVIVYEISRVRVYDRNMWALPLPDSNGQFRDCSPAFFRDNPDQIHRLHSFILRDVLIIKALGRSIGSLINAHENTITSIIMRTISIYEIHDIHMSYVLEPYLGMYTGHFCHELYNYARSPFDVSSYDQNVNYIRSREH